MSSALSDADLNASARRRRLQADLVLGCAGLFVLLTAAAMALFPGGATLDIAARHYLFFDNFLSDLGATSTYSGRPNIGSRILFTSALVVVGISFALFGPAWRAWASGRTGAFLGKVATGSAALGGCFFIATALTPWDTDYYTHTTLVRIAFAFMCVFIACLAGVQIRNLAPKRWVAANVVYVVAFAGYVAMTVFGPDVFTRHGLRVQVATQKAIVGATIMNLGLQAWGVRASTRSGHEYGRRGAALPPDLIPEATRGT